MLQIQTGLWVTQRKWCDFISYSNGLNMVIIRVSPIEKYQTAIPNAIISAEQSISDCVTKYKEACKTEDIISVSYIDHTGEITA